MRKTTSGYGFVWFEELWRSLISNGVVPPFHDLHNSSEHTQLHSIIVKYDHISEQGSVFMCAGNLRSKRFRLILEQRKTEERRSLFFALKPHEDAFYAG